MSARPKVAFVGAGAMGGALIGCAGSAKLWRPEQIAIAEPDAARRERHARAGASVVADPAELPEAHSYLLCVKPQEMRKACEGLAGSRALGDAPVISIAAGISLANLAAWLGGGELVRTMPNTPLLVGQGFTFAHGAAGEASASGRLARDLFGSVGGFCWLADESLLDAATALSGSGPAYAYLVIETMIATAKEMGIDPATAREATLATLAGACAMVAQTARSPQELRAEVTSAGGTTAAALALLQDKGFAEALAAAMAAARRRSRELSA